MAADDTRVEGTLGRDCGDSGGRPTDGIPASGGPDPVDGTAPLADEDPVGTCIVAEAAAGSGRPTTTAGPGG